MQFLHPDMILENPEKCESYYVENIVNKGFFTDVYLAKCIRGRLHGRKVAIKISRRHSRLSEQNWPAERSFHHPALLSLYSSFIVQNSRYFITEFCDRGSLCQFIESHATPGVTTNSTELTFKPILRRIAEALLFLHSQGTIHGDIRPHNVLLTADGRAKLKTFGISKPGSVYAEGNYHRAICNPEYYNSPEAADNRIPAFSWDSWSYGCLLVSCLTGSPPAKENGKHLMRNSSNPTYHSSTCLSVAVRDLVSGLLEPEPDMRLSISDALSHPFLSESRDSRTSAILVPQQKYLEISSHLTELATIFPSNSKIREVEDFDPVPIGFEEHPIPSSRVSEPISATSGASDCSSIQQYSSSANSSGIQSAWKHLLARQYTKNNEVSVTNLLSTSYESWSNGRPKLRRKPLQGVGNYGYASRPYAKGDPYGANILEDEEVGDSIEHRNLFNGLPTTRPIVSRASEPPSRESPLVNHRRVSDFEVQDLPLKCSNQDHGSPSTILQGVGISANNDRMSLIHDAGKNQLRRLQVTPLLPQTYKVSRGQIIITPSRHLLIDLRERELRAGNKGDYILRISSDGQEINVLRVPCSGVPTVLPEANQTWQLQDLPVEYWKNYRYAKNYLESVKRRTPWMVWHTSDAKFTVMSNQPKGDIHAVFPCPKHVLKERCYLSSSDISESSGTQMKLRFSREQGTLDISCYTPSAEKKGKGNWTSRSETLTQEEQKLGDQFTRKMTPEERYGMRCLNQALKVAEAAELVYVVPDTDKFEPSFEDGRGAL